jgi:16S rRNA (uracil1498-N3)-methyltransferase
MRVSRVYVDLALQVGSSVALPEAAAHYVRSVLRLKTEQTIILFDGSGDDFSCVLQEVSRKQVRVSIQSGTARDAESPLQIHLGLGISRGDRMDWSVQKAVELGVTQISPLFTERCVSRMDEDKKQQRSQHWQQIIHHAAEQSGRSRLPSLNKPQTLHDWLTQAHGMRVLLDPLAEQSWRDLPHPDAMLTVLIGPEGGLAEQERASALAQGFIAVRMGPRILRTETAVIAALSAVQSIWGDA